MDRYSFQSCQKIVVFSEDNTKILLAKRKGEQDYDGVYSFIGGKMEITDTSLISSLQREKNEEIGSACKLLLYPTFNHMRLFKKKDGSYMLIPHYYATFKNGDITLNEEYSEYQWVEVKNLHEFEPKIANIPEIVKLLLRLKICLQTNEYTEI